jgi:hypothetical protein
VLGEGDGLAGAVVLGGGDGVCVGDLLDTGVLLAVGAGAVVAGTGVPGAVYTGAGGGALVTVAAGEAARLEADGAGL